MPAPVVYPAPTPSPVVGELNYSFTQGSRATSAAQTKRIVPQYIKEIRINANLTPFLAFTEKLGQKHIVKAPTFFHSERDMNPTVILEAGFGVAVGVATIYVRPGDGQRVNIGRIIKNPQSTEGMRVTNVTFGTGPLSGGVATDTLTVTRALNGGGIGAILASQELSIQGFADVEGSQAPQPASSEPKLQTNCVQTMRYPYKLTNRDIGLEVYGTPEWERIAQDAAETCAMETEKAFLFNNFVQLSDPFITGGFQNFVQSNTTDWGGLGLTEVGMRDNLLRPFLRRNRGEKDLYVVCGENVQNAFDGFGLNNIRYKPDDDEIGIDVAYYNSGNGRLRLLNHGLFSPAGSAVTAAAHGYAGMFFAVNFSKTGQAVYKGRDTTELKNRQLPSEDAKMSELFQDKGFWIGAELCHAWGEGIGG